MKSARHGFTLVELAIILIIVALLIGAVAAQRAISHNARLKSVIADVENYKNALRLFKEKYHELPGDMPNAATFWGTDPGGCPPPDNDTPKTTTCNGNGDGIIGDVDDTPVSVASAAGYNESLRAWQHLSNAGLVKGTFNGAASSTDDLVPGLNIPASQVKGAGYTLRYAVPNDATDVFLANYRHIIIFGKPGTDVTYPSNRAVIAPEDALSIDEKADDGRPASGKVLSFPYNASYWKCASSTDPDAVYDTDETSEQCALIFITGF